MCGADLFLALLSILFPPIGVWVKCGICSADSIINILLCCLGYLPGLIHAWYIILKYPDLDFDDPLRAEYEPLPGDAQRRQGHVTYYYVSRRAPPSRPPQGADRSYGSVNRPVDSQPQVHNDTRPSSQQPQPQQPQPQQPSPQQPSPQQPQPEAGSSSNAGAGPRPPPTYAEAVKGDHKMQSQD